MRLFGAAVRRAPSPPGEATLVPPCEADVRHGSLSSSGAEPPRVERLLRAVVRPPSCLGGFALAVLCFAASVTPSLYPRPWVAQGVFSGLMLATGYAVGAGASALYRKAVRRTPAKGGALARYATAGIGIALPVWALAWNYRWQLDVRALMGVDTNAVLYPFVVAPAAALTGYVLLVLGRLVRAAHRGYVRFTSRLLGPRRALTVRSVVSVLLIALILDTVIAGHLVSEVRASLVAADARADDGAPRPQQPDRSGAPGSVVAWDTLGRMGRRFVAQGPRPAELTAFSGEPAMSPIRVYVGLASAGSARERAELAVAELERTGAFQRDVLVIITPTGTGSVNGFAIDPLEYMYNGDTAAVAMQYSYAPSWLTMIGNQERAKQGARHLFDAIETRMRQRPGHVRPTVLLYGESLGSFGSESVFEDLGDMPGRADGALWVGPPRANRLWRQLTAGRDEGSPVWQPVYREGRTVRFGYDGPTLSRPRGPWEPPRVAYLQHPSDPITWWSPELLFNRPEWLQEPRAPDVSRRMAYLPVVTFVQVGVDTVLGANAPMGHGHVYGAEQAEAWALIAPPEGWTSDSTERLVKVLANSAS